MLKRFQIDLSKDMRVIIYCNPAELEEKSYDIHHITALALTEQLAIEKSNEIHLG